LTAPFLRPLAFPSPFFDYTIIGERDGLRQSFAPLTGLDNKSRKMFLPFVQHAGECRSRASDLRNGEIEVLDAFLSPLPAAKGCGCIWVGGFAEGNAVRAWRGCPEGVSPSIFSYVLLVPLSPPCERSPLSRILSPSYLSVAVHHLESCNAGETNQRQLLHRLSVATPPPIG